MPVIRTADTAPLNSRRTPRHVLSGVVAPALRTGDTASSAVFAAARHLGPVARDAIAAGSGLSIATVNRQVSVLLEANLLRERPDLATPGAIGRPRIPVEVNHEPYLTIGFHIGARITSIVASDLFGRTLDAVETQTPTGPQATALASLADSARRYLSRWHRRRPLWIGVAVGGVVDSVGGLVDHPRLGWVQAPVGPVLAKALGLPISVASHVDAMAGAELLLTAHHRGSPESQPVRGNSLYVYARETVGFAQVIDGRVHTPTSGPGTIAGLPVQSELLGGTGHLESTVSDEAVVSAARKRGILPATGPNSTVSTLMRVARNSDTQAVEARELLAERGRVLGGAVALLRDILNPDEVVVGGQAFTEYPEGLRQVRAAVEGSLLPGREIRLARFGNRVQEAGAGVVSLSTLYADPLNALRRSGANRSHLSA